MKKWVSYALWKWRRWFVRTKHNSSICVFEFKLFVCCSIASNIQTNFLVLGASNGIKSVKSMKNWASYALWKWRGWFAKIEHNNSVRVFEFKLFVCCSIAYDIQTNFLVLFLAHPMVQKMLKSMKNQASYALWKWRGWFAKTKHNNSICVFEFKFFAYFSITFNIPKYFVFLLLAHPILLIFLNLIKKWKRYVHWKWSGVIQAQINNLKM